MNKNLVLLVVIIATIFGFGSGAVGYIVSRVYLLEDSFNIPMFGEISFLNENPNASGVVIRGAKKVIVEQNTKVKETIKNSQQSVVGIYQKAEPIAKEDKGLLDGTYYLKESLAEGLIITSDGWLVSDYSPTSLVNLKSTSSEVIKNFTKEYIAIDKNRNIYEVDNFIHDKDSAFSFWHVVARDLPVKRFVPDSEIENGQIVLVVNYLGEVFISTIQSQELNLGQAVLSSDLYNNQISLNDKLGSDFFSGFLFNLNGDIVGLINSEGETMSIDSFLPCINCLLNKKDITKPWLGINYTSLGEYIGVNNNREAKGVLITKDDSGVAVVKNSPAEKAGLKEGDIVLSFNNVELSNGNNLSFLLSKYKVGNEIKLLVERAGEEREITIKLGKK